MTQTESAILAHARRCAPAESCGFVVRTPEGERYIPCVNISAGKRAARTVLTGMCYSVGSATRQGSSSPTRFIGQSAMTSRT
ncbi:hypothetical protein HIG13_005241 [Escherichia coli]|nr:hypothetical protein [Escherichia coli]EFH2192693.1 hypothetical protein [Escherichia coli]EFH2501691.1 hypothetical protein [Escherichia coli]EFH2713443.1 hypothetical protein [Escherichia coli]EFH3025643.1 hypothetical protein [Escherichia coli]